MSAANFGKYTEIQFPAHLVSWVAVWADRRPDLPWQSGDIKAIAEQAYPDIDWSRSAVTFGSEVDATTGATIQFIQRFDAIEEVNCA